MNNYYDWEKNVIHVQDTLENEFEFQLRGNIVIVDGASATGKSMFTSIVSALTLNNVYTDDELQNVIVIDKNTKERILNQKRKLIIIDRAEYVFDNTEDSNIIEFINSDISNRYLLFARGPLDIHISPNYYAEIVRENNKFILEYAFNIKGWN